MTDKKKSIGNQQPLPAAVIKETILEYLETHDVNKDNLLLKVKEKYAGENRAKKISNAIYAIITNKNALNTALLKNFTLESFYKLSEDDKNVIAMSLICLRYPFSYNLIFSFAKLFNVQDTVNKQYITEKMASIYGSNLSLEHGIASSLNIAVDCGFLKREKIGLYSKIVLDAKSDFAKEAWIATFFELNGKKAVCINDLEYEPVMSYLSDLEIDWRNTKILETMQDYSNQIVISKLK